MSSRERFALALVAAAVVVGVAAWRLRADLRAARDDADRGKAYRAILGYVHDHAGVAQEARRGSEHPS